jgi:hypothetical protein
MRTVGRLAVRHALVDRRREFVTWAEEFASAHELNEKWITWLIFADAHYSGPMYQFFAMMREQFDLGGSADLLWAQYCRRMQELISCKDPQRRTSRSRRRLVHLWRRWPTEARSRLGWV